MSLLLSEIFEVAFPKSIGAFKDWLSDGIDMCLIWRVIRQQIEG
jgi:hypothetical protein